MENALHTAGWRLHRVRQRLRYEPGVLAQQLSTVQTTKKNGLGIGMFHSKMIVEAHRGRIEVESAPGQGTTFRVVATLLPPAV